MNFMQPWRPVWSTARLTSAHDISCKLLPQPPVTAGPILRQGSTR